MSDIDDMLREMWGDPAPKPPPKPQPPKAEVFSSPEPRKRRKKARKGREEADTDDLVYRAVPKSKTLPRCGTCRTMLHAGDKHWYYVVDGDQFWWCVKCMKRGCKLHPPEETP